MYQLTAKNAVWNQWNLSKNFEANVDILKSGGLKASQNFEKEKYHARTTIELLILVKQDTRSHPKQISSKDDCLRNYTRTP